MKIKYKILRQELKANYTQINVAEMLSFIGYEVNRDFKFKLRDEKTPSASISKNGMIRDFGSGFSGDIVSLLHEYKNIPLANATIYVAQLLNINIERFKDE